MKKLLCLLCSILALTGLASGQDDFENWNDFEEFNDSDESVIEQTERRNNKTVSFEDDLFPLKVGSYTVYGSARDFLILGSAGLFGLLVDTFANLEVNLCLTDFSRLLEMGYFAWYYWDSWFASGDESETVKAIIYTIQAWRVGFNLRCY